MFTIAQLEAIRDKANAKAEWYANAPAPRGPGYALDFYKQNTARLIAEFRAIAFDCQLLIDVPDDEDAMASIEQALDAWHELDVVAQENTADAAAHLASLTPERRAALNLGWAA